MARNTATGISLKTSDALVAVLFNARYSILERSMTVNKRHGVKQLKFSSMDKHSHGKWLFSLKTVLFPKVNVMPFRSN